MNIFLKGTDRSRPVRTLQKNKVRTFRMGV